MIKPKKIVRKNIIDPYTLEVNKKILHIQQTFGTKALLTYLNSFDKNYEYANLFEIYNKLVRFISDNFNIEIDSLISNKKDGIDYRRIICHLFSETIKIDGQIISIILDTHYNSVLNYINRANEYLANNKIYPTFNIEYEIVRKYLIQVILENKNNMYRNGKN